MTAPVFGYTPLTRPLALTTGADFFLNLVLQGTAEWPEGTQLTIEVADQVWNATIADNVARWRIESDHCDLIPDKAPYVMKVSYPNTSQAPERDDLVWFYGKVKRTRLT